MPGVVIHDASRCNLGCPCRVTLAGLCPERSSWAAEGLPPHGHAMAGLVFALKVLYDEIGGEASRGAFLWCPRQVARRRERLFRVSCIKSGGCVTPSPMRRPRRERAAAAGGGDAGAAAEAALREEPRAHEPQGSSDWTLLQKGLEGGSRCACSAGAGGGAGGGGGKRERRERRRKRGGSRGRRAARSRRRRVARATAEPESCVHSTYGVVSRKRPRLVTRAARRWPSRRPSAGSGACGPLRRLGSLGGPGADPGPEAGAEAVRGRLRRTRRRASDSAAQR